MSTRELNTDMEQANFLQWAAALARENHRIDPALFRQFNVKRGLRNQDGSGVLVGLTRIGEVHGYVMDESEKKAVEGRLRYRGQEIEDIVERFRGAGRLGFHEVIFLLLLGRYPTNEELLQFDAYIGARRELPDGFTENMILKAPSPDVMNKLARSVLAAYSYDPNPDELSVANVLRQCLDLIARFPVMVAYGYQAKRHYYDNLSLYIHRPKPKLGVAADFLRLIRPDEAYTELEAETLDLCLVLHAEHGGGNNSTFAVHVVSSSDTDTYSAIAAAVGSLRGPKHGGANVKVVQMMQDLQKSVGSSPDHGRICDYLRRVIRKEAFDGSGLIYGMGHAVYTISDPRATILRAKAATLAEGKGQRETFEYYQAVENAARELLTENRGGKSVATNVDFYSGLVYSMLDLPPELYTPMFAISRVAGWCAHRLEELVSGGKIIRPAYKSVTGLHPSPNDN